MQNFAMGCVESKVSENNHPNRFDVIFADTDDSVYYNSQLEINGKNFSNRHACTDTMIYCVCCICVLFFFILSLFFLIHFLST